MNGRGQFVSTVKANIPLCREHYRLVLRLDQFPGTEPGQFVQIECRDEVTGTGEVEREDGWGTKFSDADLIGREAMLRRPFSLAGRQDVDGAVEIDIIHRVVGVGTNWLSRLAPGDQVNVLGPLGNVFPAPRGKALMVAGGVGIPPMIYLARKLANHPAIAICGVVSRDLLPLTLGCEVSPTGDARLCIEEFSQHNVPTIITTDDGSLGLRGFVTDALDRYLDTHKDDDTTLYTCGPEIMMKRVAQIGSQRNIPCHVAVERAMACGMGTCQSCVIRVAAENQRGWVYKLACTDGPVFEGTTLRW
jgi:dihydroorotate dehydrogenase electron transfer subunit